MSVELLLEKSQLFQQKKRLEAEAEKAKQREETARKAQLMAPVYAFFRDLDSVFLRKNPAYATERIKFQFCEQGTQVYWYEADGNREFRVNANLDGTFVFRGYDERIHPTAAGLIDDLTTHLASKVKHDVVPAPKPHVRDITGPGLTLALDRLVKNYNCKPAKDLQAWLEKNRNL